MELLVFAPAYFRVQMYRECERLNSDEIQIEKRVKVRTQQQPIIRVIIQISTVRPDVSRFQHVQDVAAGNGAPAPITSTQLFSKCLLTSARTNLSKQALAFIAFSRHVT